MIETIVAALVAILAGLFGFSQWKARKRAEDAAQEAKALEARTRANAQADAKADAQARLEHDRREREREAATAARRAEDTARAEASAARVDAEGSIASEVDRAWLEASAKRNGGTKP